MKGRSRAMEKRISTHPHKPHATSQPPRNSLTHRLGTDSNKQLAQPLTAPHAHVPSWRQHWNYKASFVTQTLLPRDDCWVPGVGVVSPTASPASVDANPTNDQPTPAVHLSIPPLHRHRQQLHCPAHKFTLGNAATLSCDVPKVVHELHRLLAHVPARLNRKRHKEREKPHWGETNQHALTQTPCDQPAIAQTQLRLTAQLAQLRRVVPDEVANQ